MRIAVSNNEIADGIFNFAYCGGDVKETPHGEKYVSHFECVSEEFGGVTVPIFCNTVEAGKKYTEKHKLVLLMADLAGCDPKAVKSLDDESHVGTVYRCVVGHTESGNPKIEKILGPADDSEVDADPPF